MRVPVLIQLLQEANVSHRIAFFGQNFLQMLNLRFKNAFSLQELNEKLSFSIPGRNC